MKKILYVVHNLIIGGIEKVCWEILNNIDTNEYKIDFLVATSEDRVQYYDALVKEKGCNVYKGGLIVDKNSKEKFLNYEKELIMKNKYDIVHAHMDFMNIWILRTAKKCGVKTRVSHVHTTYYHENNIGIKKALYNFKTSVQISLMNCYATSKLGCSKEACNCFYGKNKGTVLFNGFNINTFDEYSIASKNPYQFITIGRIDEQKNPLFILEVMKELVDIDDHYKLSWIGKGKLFDCVYKKAEEYKLLENICFVGATTEIGPYLSSSSYALFPSTYEGLGIALVETQLSGIFTFYSDSIPIEANIGYAKDLSLSLTARDWAKYIDEFIRSNKEKNYKIDAVRRDRYNIEDTVIQLCKIYDGK